MKTIMALPARAAFTALLFLALAALADVITVISDASWRTTVGFNSDYVLPTFDDQSWADAIAGYVPYDRAPYGLTDAEAIWGWDGVNVPIPGNGPNLVTFRNTITIDGTVDMAQFTYVVDDFIRVYVNGQERFFSGDVNPYGASWVSGMDATSWFSEGDNTVAIAAWDGDRDNSWNRGGEWTAYRFDIQSTHSVPEAASVSLMAAGLVFLAGLGGVQSQRKRK